MDITYHDDKVLKNKLLNNNLDTLNKTDAELIKTIHTIISNAMDRGLTSDVTTNKIALGAIVHAAHMENTYGIANTYTEYQQFGGCIELAHKWLKYCDYDLAKLLNIIKDIRSPQTITEFDHYVKNLVKNISNQQITIDANLMHLKVLAADMLDYIDGIPITNALPPVLRRIASNAEDIIATIEKHTQPTTQKTVGDYLNLDTETRDKIQPGIWVRYLEPSDLSNHADVFDEPGINAPANYIIVANQYNKDVIAYNTAQQLYVLDPINMEAKFIPTYGLIPLFELTPAFAPDGSPLANTQPTNSAG